MSLGRLGQEQVPLSVENEELRDFLNRRFIDIGSLFFQAPKFPERKQMPYKPQFGDIHYFGDPTTHQYDTQIIEQGWWGWFENLPATDPPSGRWAKMKTTQGTIALEDVVLRKRATIGVYADGEFIDNYDEAKALSPYALIEYDLVAGTITIGVSGWYQVDMFMEATGSDNQDYYGLIGRNESAGVDTTIGISQWHNTTPSMAWSGIFHAYLTAGTVVVLKAYCSAGDLTTIAVSVSIQMTSYE